MIERHVTFDVFPDKVQDFVKLFVEEYRPAMASMSGFVKVGLLREHENPNSYKMVVRFLTTEDAATWRNSSLHQVLSPKLKAFYRSSQLLVYEVIE